MACAFDSIRRQFFIAVYKRLLALKGTYGKLLTAISTLLKLKCLIFNIERVIQRVVSVLISVQ